MASSQECYSPSYMARAASSFVLWRWIGSSKSSFLSVSLNLSLWTSWCSPGTMSGVVSFGEDPLSLDPALCMWDPKEGKKQWRTRTIFLLLRKLVVMVSTQQYLFKRNRISADKEINEGFLREKSEILLLKLSSMLRSTREEINYFKLSWSLK